MCMVTSLCGHVISAMQHTCIVLWNVCLPLLQHNLRHVLLRPLTALASALEGMQRSVGCVIVRGCAFNTFTYSPFQLAL